MKNVLSILDQIESGQLTGDDAETALEFVAGEFGKTAFGEGGKQLTSMEKALLQGTIPTIEIREANLLQKVLGKESIQSGSRRIEEK